MVKNRILYECSSRSRVRGGGRRGLEEQVGEESSRSFTKARTYFPLALFSNCLSRKLNDTASFMQRSHFTNLRHTLTRTLREKCSRSTAFSSSRHCAERTTYNVMLPQRTAVQVSHAPGGDRVHTALAQFLGIQISECENLSFSLKFSQACSFSLGSSCESTS